MSQPPALLVADLVVSYGARRVVDHLSLAAHAGQVTAVLGPNGAGKTTTIECAEGLRRADSGTIEVLGHAPGSPAARARTGVMLQDGGLPLARSVRDVLRLAAALHRPGWGTSTLLEHLDLTAVAGTSVRRLSGGQRQRLALAIALIARPDLLFLDEPSAGMDPAARREVFAVLDELRTAGTAIVLTTHLLTEAEELADTVHVLSAGRLLASGSPRELVAQHAASDAVRLRLRHPLSEDLSAELSRLSTSAPLMRDGEWYLIAGAATPARIATVTAWCAQAEVEILELRVGGGTLEHAYFALLGSALLGEQS